MKRLLTVHDAPPQHWVGDGFPVRSLFNYRDHALQLSPFLMLDHAAETRFAPAARPRGVGIHPHRGFETVTIVYQGELEHRDSTGASGRIGAGDVQWMTAAGGILHEEFHSREFTRSGGLMEMVQLWVNLPARDKMGPPGYQSIAAADIPQVQLADQAGRLRVIAGEYLGQRGPARTHTAMDVWDIQLRAGARVILPSPGGHTLAVVALRGRVRVNDTDWLAPGQLAVFERDGESALLQADDEALLLWLSGEPIDEPVVGYGPFVMNTREEIAQAIEQFNRGEFARPTVHPAVV